MPLPRAFRVTYRRDIPMYSLVGVLCEEIIEADSTEELVDFLNEHHAIDVVEIKPLSGEL